MKSVQHSFAQIPNAPTERSTFNRDSALKTTFDAGHLVPVYCEEALPGDTWNLRMHTFARLSTPLHPIMDNMYLDSFFFAVPMRLLWSNWQKFNGEQTDPGDSTEFTIPIMDTGLGVGAGSLHDFIGIPPGVPGLEFSAMWHRGYNLIYNEWFRDENLIDSVAMNTGDGPDSLVDYTLLRRGKRRDYFTSCLPWPQKGDAVTLPLGTSAPVAIFGDPVDTAPSFGRNGPGSGLVELEHDTTTINVDWDNPPALGGTGTAWWQIPRLSGTADLSTATASTINQIRQAFQIQKLYERDARGGSRYTEIIRAHFGVTSPDQRLQRPEYLGGGSQNISVTPVPQTSSTDGTSPQGNLASYGVSSGSNHSFTHSFTEHCVIIGLISVRADLNYQQGLHRMFSRQTRWDFFWPALAHIGEQAVLNKEIFAQGSDDPTADAAVFGYQGRFDEYRFGQSKITGAMRSSHAQSLDTWHLAQEFLGLPVLNGGFIVENPPISRIVAVTSEPDFLFDALFDVKCARKMPMFGVPGGTDKF